MGENMSADNDNVIYDETSFDPARREAYYDRAEFRFALINEEPVEDEWQEISLENCESVAAGIARQIEGYLLASAEAGRMGILTYQVRVPKPVSN